MKRIVIAVLTILFMWGGSSSASTYTVDLHNLSDVYGFGFDIITDSAASDTDFELTLGEAVPLMGTNGSFWQVWIANNPSFGVQGADQATSAPLGEGTILTLNSEYEFILDNFLLGGNTPDGKYPYEFRVDFKPNTNIYTYNAVPIPGAIWLFGSGLVGLLGIGRNRCKK